MPTGLKNPVEQVRHYSHIKIAYPLGHGNSENKYQINST
jgi:hypothetical protein